MSHEEDPVVDPEPGASSWRSRDGVEVTIRPIAARDYALEKAFIDGLSYETGLRRLLSPRRPQSDEIARFTDIDPAREMAWIGVSSASGHETMCGVARYVRELPDRGRAEWAIVLADAWQRRGLGEKLLRVLIASARGAGVATLSDVTFSTNVAMQGLARKLGFRLSREPGDATLTRMTLRLDA